MRYWLIFILSVYILPAFSQILEDFSDGNFSTNPVWEGDSLSFLVVNHELKLNAPSVSDTAILYSKNKVSLNAVWTGLIRLNFNPSSSNYARVYLTIDQKKLEDGNGYYLEFGSTKDNVSLYKQSVGTAVNLLEGKKGRIGGSNNNVRFKVIRDSLHQWSVFVDSSGGMNYAFEGVIQDSTFVHSSYFGVFCKYTSTRSDKFYFDDFEVIGNPFVDNTPPTIIEHKIISKNEWHVVFSEPIDSTNLTTTHFKLESSQEFPSEIQYHSKTNSIVCRFNREFNHGVIESLTISNLKDTSENVMLNKLIRDVYTNIDSVNYKDIIFNEFMIDPSPSVKLPEEEYIELYNNSNRILKLEHISLEDAKDTFKFPEKWFFPGEFLLISNSNDSIFTSYCSDTSILYGMPGLSNESDHIKLLYQHKILDSVSYDKDWTSHSDGGKSLELINPFNQCHDKSNWTFSDSELGGSPGKLNSVHINSPIEEKFKVLSIQSSIDTLIKIRISGPKILDQQTISATMFPESEFSFEIYNENLWHFKPSSFFAVNQNYSIHLSNLVDCHSNNHDLIIDDVIVPGSISSHDVVINEILFNPYPNGHDFIELFNSSNKNIDLSECYLSNEVDDTSLISDSFLLIKPYDYLVLSEFPEELPHIYPRSELSNMIQTDLPSFKDKSGSVFLSCTDRSIIDLIQYSEDFHFSLLEEIDGVSLERISPYSNGTTSENWASASSNDNYATPGYKNSQYVDFSKTSSALQIIPDIFSPDNDGFDDHVQIKFNIGLNRTMGSVRIFNQQGLKIKELQSQSLLPTKGYFIWDGTDENNNISPMGFYLVVFKYFDLQGNIKIDKKTVVLAHKL